MIKMKKLLFLLLLLASCSLSYAQTQEEQVRVWKAGESKRFTTSELLFINNGATLAVEDSTYDVMTIDSITVVHTVNVTFSGDVATVDLGHAPHVTYTIDGAHVNITSTNTKSELEFVLQGESTHGSLTYDGPLKCRFYLNGLNLKSDRGAAIDIRCGKRVDLILNEGTDNVLADAAGGEQKAALYCKGHLEVSGGGNLTVTGNARHGIATKEYMELKKSTGKITINKAASDAMHIGQYFLMSGGKVIIDRQAGDGIQVEYATKTYYDDDEDESNDSTVINDEKEFNGQIFIRGGQLNITARGDCTKAIKAEDNMTISGGSFTINAIGEGTKGISVSGDLMINQDDNPTVIIVDAKGGSYEDEDENETYCMGIKVKGNLTILAGTVKVSRKGVGTKGIQYGGEYVKGEEASVTPEPAKKEEKTNN